MTILLLAAVAEGQNAPVVISVDASKNLHPISPLIYGVAFASAAHLSDINVPLNRQGGNGTTAYDWMSNSSNRAADWFYESIGETSATPGEFARHVHRRQRLGRRVRDGHRADDRPGSKAREWSLEAGQSLGVQVRSPAKHRLLDAGRRQRRPEQRRRGHRQRSQRAPSTCFSAATYNGGETYYGFATVSRPDWTSAAVRLWETTAVSLPP